MTKEEVCMLMRQLEFVFDTVRLVDVSANTQFLVSDAGEITAEPYKCYDVWNKTRRCDNCISARAFACRGKMTKFEFADNDIYHVIAVYIEADGEPYVLEAVTEINDDILFGAYGKVEFAEVITQYNRKLYTDPVTGAYNRRYYNEQLRGLTDISAVAMLDMDNFKSVNDTYGHSAGDAALKTVSDILHSCCGDADTVVRYGGDEFLIIFKDISLNTFSGRLDGIRDAVSKAVPENYPDVELSISIGGAYGQADTARMFEKADAMLYQAKVSKNSIRIAEYNEGKGEAAAESGENTDRGFKYGRSRTVSMLDCENLKRAFDTMPAAFAVIRVITDESGNAADFRFEYVNDTMSELAETEKEAISGAGLCDVFSDHEWACLNKYYLSAYCGEKHRIHSYSRRLNKYLDIHCFPWEKGCCACIMLDETDLVNSKAGLIYANYHDALTGFGNRDSYMYYCRSLEKGMPESLGIAIMDINNLSRINQSLGNGCGDRVLKKTAECIKEYFMPEQAFRIGGDEFVIAVKDCPRELFKEKLGNVRRKIKELDFGDVSCGYIWEQYPRNIDTLFHNADKLMHMDKEEYYLKDDIRHVGRKSVLLHKLLEDLSDKRYTVFFQPQIDIEHGNRLYGAEALVRYFDDNGLLVNPSHFISGMEEEAIISHLDFAVFEEVCRIVSSWDIEKLPSGFRVAVNFSRITLALPDFFDEIERIRKRTGVPASCLTIEVTETQKTFSQSRMQALFSAISAAGYAVSLDDFGTGSSSLENVAAISWSSMKIDMSLVHMLPVSERMTDLLSHLCEYGLKNNISRIAEGVETEEQLEAVRQIGCNAVQGYYYDRPMPAKDFHKRYIEKKY